MLSPRLQQHESQRQRRRAALRVGPQIHHARARAQVVAELAQQRHIPADAHDERMAAVLQAREHAVAHQPRIGQQQRALRQLRQHRQQQVAFAAVAARAPAPRAGCWPRDRA
ncbi:MAG: hypothetical protein HRU75_02530 [Planctomycetia bacterium]|nr:MAG: hypothetical protein HRU75_02530 [Planctomycetia bacterium]